MHPARYPSISGISRISNFPELLNFPRWLVDNEIEDAKSTQPVSDTIQSQCFQRWQSPRFV